MMKKLLVLTVLLFCTKAFALDCQIVKYNETMNKKEQSRRALVINENKVKVTFAASTGMIDGCPLAIKGNIGDVYYKVLGIQSISGGQGYSSEYPCVYKDKDIFEGGLCNLDECSAVISYYACKKPQ